MRFRLLLALLALILASCGGDDPPDPPPPAEYGSARITWSIEAPDGTAQTCTDLGIEEMSVALGGVPIIKICGDEQVVEFERKPPGRYAVIIRMIGYGSSLITEDASNIIIEADKTAAHHVTLVIDRDKLSKGDLRIRWRIDDELPSTHCSIVNATGVRISSEPSSIEIIPTEIHSCTGGEVLLEGLKKGTHVFRVQLVDASERLLFFPKIVSIDVVAGETVISTAAFYSGSIELASLVGLWTVTSSPATDACGPIHGDYVKVDVIVQDVQSQILVATATAACTTGRVDIDDIGGGRGYKTVFTLFDDFPGTVLTSSVVRDLVFVNGETATVAVDLDL